MRSNINGFFNILSLSEKHKVKKIIFASSSSVYGLKNSLSNQENQATDKPLSFYAATKKSNESMAYTYSHLYKIPIIGIRFLQFMDHGEDQIWLSTNLPKKSYKIKI